MKKIEPTCSFCGVTKSKTGVLISSNDDGHPAICDLCIKQANKRMKITGDEKVIEMFPKELA